MPAVPPEKKDPFRVVDRDLDGARAAPITTWCRTVETRRARTAPDRMACRRQAMRIRRNTLKHEQAQRYGIAMAVPEG
ncbi:MAG: hypothetical protein R2864_05435 [Syntrophotaleaceae bacterium]